MHNTFAEKRRSAAMKEFSLYGISSRAAIAFDSSVIGGSSSSGIKIQFEHSVLIVVDV